MWSISFPYLLPSDLGRSSYSLFGLHGTMCAVSREPWPLLLGATAMSQRRRIGRRSRCINSLVVTLLLFVTFCFLVALSMVVSHCVSIYPQSVSNFPLCNGRDGEKRSFANTRSTNKLVCAQKISPARSFTASYPERVSAPLGLRTFAQCTHDDRCKIARF
jgi:hypothetical protein